MPDFYGKEMVVAQALQGLFGGIDQRRKDAIAEQERKRLTARQDAADKQAADVQRIGMALQRAQLSAAGIREGEAPTATYQLPSLAMDGSTVGVVDKNRYQTLGDGFYVDRNATPAFQQEQAKRQAATSAQNALEQRTRIVGQALQASNPAEAVQMLVAAGMSPAEAKTTIEAGRAPEAKAPVMGSPEWEKAYRKQKQIDAEFSPRSGGGGAGGAGGPGQPSVDSNEIMKWRGEFAKLTANERAASDGFSRLKAATAKGVNNMTASDDIGLIYGFMKIQDPGSTVREGEYATAEQATGVPERVVQLYNKAKDGQKLTPEMRRQFLETATQGARSANESVRRRAQEIIPTLTRLNINPSDVIVSPFSGLLDGEEKPRSSATQQRPVAGGDTAFQQEVQLAYDAIAKGKDPRVVARGFRARTGKELPK